MSAQPHRIRTDLAYVTLGGITGFIAMVTWTAGLSAVISLAILIIGIPMLVLAGTAFRWVAELDRQNARLVLGAPIGRSYRAPTEPGFWPLLRTTLRDPQVGRDTAWLIVHSVVGTTFAIIVWSLIAVTLAAATLPIWAHTLPQEAVDWGFWQPDTLERRALVALTALPLAGLTLVAIRAFARAESWLARWLLSPRGPETPLDVSAPSVNAARLPQYRAEAVLVTHAVITAVTFVFCSVIWLAADRGEFWPAWVGASLALTVALHLAVIRFARAKRPEQRLEVAAEASLAVTLYLVVIWLLDGAAGSFWPIWPALSLGLLLAAAALLMLAPWRDREELAERVAVLTRTRSDAVDAQATELRRIERDLHDGAQARLVALSMQLGRAEARLADRPEEAALIREARAEASAAIAELRDLSRGIAPPVLVDRGLVAAVEALAGRAPMDVTVDANLRGRLPAAVENAAYFVCAEALTNAAKHASGAEVQVRIERDAAALLVSVHDSGPGGADSGGSGLTGLRQRVAALDGTLHVASASGQGTTISAELPCAS